VKHAHTVSKVLALCVEVNIKCQYTRSLTEGSQVDCRCQINSYKNA